MQKNADFIELAQAARTGFNPGEADRLWGSNATLAPKSVAATVQTWFHTAMNTGRVLTGLRNVLRKRPGLLVYQMGKVKKMGLKIRPIVMLTMRIKSWESPPWKGAGGMSVNPLLTDIPLNPPSKGDFLLQPLIRIYNEFRRTVALPYPYIERMYTTKYVRHFYSEDEIQRLKAKWSKTGP